MKRKYDHVFYEKLIQLKVRNTYSYLDFGKMNNYEVYFFGALLFVISEKMDKGEILGGLNSIDLHEILGLGFLYKLKKETQLSIVNEAISDLNKIKYYSVDDSKWRRLILFESIELIDDSKVEFTPTPLLYDFLWYDSIYDFVFLNLYLHSTFKNRRDSALYRLACRSKREQIEFKSKDLQNILFMRSDRELNYFIDNKLESAIEYYKDILKINITNNGENYTVDTKACEKVDYSILLFPEFNMLIDTYDLKETDDIEEFIEFILYDDSKNEELDYFLLQAINKIIQFHSIVEGQYDTDFSIQTLSARLLETIKKGND